MSKSFSAWIHNAVLLALTGLVVYGAGWIVFHVGLAIPSTVRSFTDIALNAFCAFLLVILIGGMMVGFALVIAGLGYYLARQILSHLLQPDDL